MSAKPLVLTGADVLDGAGGRLRDAAVVIEGERIAEIGPAPPGRPGRPVTGLTVLPGFIDAHVHLGFADPRAVLGGGVTTVRDLGSSAGARDSAAGAGLRVRHAGRILTPPGGYPLGVWAGEEAVREVSDPADAAAAVAEQVAAGASVVKVALEDLGGEAPLFDAATLAAVVAAADDHDLAVTAHVSSRDALALALEAGVGELAHLPLFDVTPTEMFDVAAAGVVVVPTLAVRGPPPRPDAWDALAGFRQGGGRVVYGTDLGNRHTAPGILLAEVEGMIGAGMSPAEVLAAATSDAADYLGLADVGRIMPGARADLIAVDGDPLTDPTAYTRVRLVVAAGRVVRDDLHPGKASVQ